MKTKVTELTHDDIVTILADGLYGCSHLGLDYNSEDWESLPEEKREGECIEDKCADLLLNGKSITIADFYAEDYGIHSTKGKMVKNLEWSIGCEEVGEYTITLQDVLDACSTPDGLRCASHLLLDETGDHWDAYNIIQIAMFGEIIYG